MYNPTEYERNNALNQLNTINIILKSLLNYAEESKYESELLRVKSIIAQIYLSLAHETLSLYILPSPKKDEDVVETEVEPDLNYINELL